MIPLRILYELLFHGDTSSQLWPIFLWIYTLYIIGVATFIIMENRQPSSTFAWLFFFMIAPIFGLLVYLIFGRDRRVFSA